MAQFSKGHKLALENSRHSATHTISPNFEYYKEMVIALSTVNDRSAISAKQSKRNTIIMYTHFLVDSVLKLVGF